MQQLLASDWEVGIILRPSGHPARLAKISSSIRVFNADLADQVSVKAAVDLFRPERCIHLAWYAEPGHYLHSRENVAAVSQSLSLLQMLIESGCRHVVMAGTCAECDPLQGRLVENGPTAPSTLYAASKWSLYLMAREVAKRAGIKLAWARIFYLFGPGEDVRRLIPSLISTLLAGREFPATTGSQIRDYLHVDDVASAFVRLSEMSSEGIFHVASGSGVTIRHLIEMVADIVGRRELIRFGARPTNDWDPETIIGDNSHTRSSGWKPEREMRESLKGTIEWWKDQAAYER